MQPTAKSAFICTLNINAKFVIAEYFNYSRLRFARMQSVKLSQLAKCFVGDVRVRIYAIYTMLAL